MRTAIGCAIASLVTLFQTPAMASNAVSQVDVDAVRSFLGWQKDKPESVCVARIYDRSRGPLNFDRVGGDARFRASITIGNVDMATVIPANSKFAIIVVLGQSGTAYPKSSNGEYTYNWAIAPHYKFPSHPSDEKPGGLRVIIENNDKGDHFDIYVHTDDPFIKTGFPEGYANECDSGSVGCPCVAN